MELSAAPKTRWGINQHREGAFALLAPAIRNYEKVHIDDPRGRIRPDEGRLCPVFRNDQGVKKRSHANEGRSDL